MSLSTAPVSGSKGVTPSSGSAPVVPSIPVAQSTISSEKKTEGKFPLGKVTGSELPLSKLRELKASSPEEKLNAVTKLLSECRANKLNLIKTISKSFGESGDAFAKEFVEVEFAFLELISICSEIKNPSELEVKTAPWLKQMNLLNGTLKLIQLKECLNEFNHTYNPVYYVERCLNWIINEKLIDLKAKFYAYHNGHLMCQMLGANLEALRPTGLSHKRTDGETHNGGRTTFFVSFIRKEKEGEKEVYKFVLKFRQAYADAEAIGLLDKLNQANKNKAFPSYKICNVTPTTKDWKFVEGFEEISVWDYVEGERLKGFGSLTTTNPSSTRILEIFKKVGVNDQHYENYIRQTNSLLVPIDMESRVCKKEEPKLEKEKKEPKLEGESAPLFSVDEEPHVEAFIKSNQEVPYRVVPEVGTNNLTVGPMKLIANNMTIKSYAEPLIQEFKGSCGFTQLNEDLLETLVLWDFLNRDIPYFTHYQGKLYWSLQSFDMVVGSK